MASSSPAVGGFKTLQEEIAYYKLQYEQLEVELQEFQASSRELEAELEKDVDASEKRERQLKEKSESLSYEVDEWKAKYRQSKTEASTAQANLQKEVTSLRDTNRTLQFRLRDIEVVNDDFERQARNTTTSLEDLESRYNQSLERTVMLDEEIKIGEQERENLRIETQRLKDELSDLRIEADITQEKLRVAESASGRRLKRISQLSDPKDHMPQSPISEGSITSASLTSSFASPPPKSESSAPTSHITTPPSPPLSEVSGNRKTADATAMPAPQDPNSTPKPGALQTRRPQHLSRPSGVGPNIQTPVFKRRTGLPTPRASGINQEAMPRTESLYQIRGLIGKMQKLEKRVQTARSKLPAPTDTPPRASPRGNTPTISSAIPSSVTVRSSKKRSSVSMSVSNSTASGATEDSARRLSQRPSRISFVGASAGADSRPSSRTSNVSHSGAQFVRPTSRAEAGYRPSSAADMRRPGSSMSGAYSAHSHRQSRGPFIEAAEDEHVTPTPRRFDTSVNTKGVPTPSALNRRQSAQALVSTPARRKSMRTLVPALDGQKAGKEKPRDVDLGETF